MRCCTGIAASAFAMGRKQLAITDNEPRVLLCVIGSDSSLYCNLLIGMIFSLLATGWNVTMPDKDLA